MVGLPAKAKTGCDVGVAEAGTRRGGMTTPYPAKTLLAVLSALTAVGLVAREKVGVETCVCLTVADRKACWNRGSVSGCLATSRMTSVR